ncbi:MAG: bifunctional diaminohydroxyphosphoribosylaminopyrimidine deaminase/5-amino-6-(5-phosphoribosylamino)uracil reductase RibD [Patescibacteria group bacterium]
MQAKVDHEFFIRQAFLQAEKGRGQVSPNPLVGAIIVKDGIILARGYHHKFQGIHGEVDAINKALKKHGHKKLKGASLYVNLEPCAHYGSNPPCTDIISSYNFKQVIFSNLDPNPLVNGKGKRALRKFNINVIDKILESEGKELNKVYFKSITQKMPFIYLKTALSLDGKITHPNNKYISSKPALQYVHELRSQVDAILVGYNTNVIDKPKLTCHIKGKRNPKKLILPKNKIDLVKYLHDLYMKGICSILVEGGSQVITSFLEQQLADKVILIYTPEIFGKQQLNYCQKLSKVVKLQQIQTKILGKNIIIEGYA